MSKTLVKDAATEAWKELESEYAGEGKTLKTTEKEAKQLVEKTFKKIGDRFQNRDISMSDIVRQVENAASN